MTEVIVAISTWKKRLGGAIRKFGLKENEDAEKPQKLMLRGQANEMLSKDALLLGKLKTRSQAARIRVMNSTIETALARGVEVDTRGTNALKVGDMKQYSRENLAKRDKLRRSTLINVVVAEWWNSVSEDDKIDKVLYKEIFTPLYFRLVRQGTLRAAKIAVEDDWNVDSGGHPYLDQDRFFFSLFSLADTWCDTSKEGDYVDFLKDMFKLSESSREKNGKKKKQQQQQQPIPTRRQTITKKKTKKLSITIKTTYNDPSESKAFIKEENVKPYNKIKKQICRSPRNCGRPQVMFSGFGDNSNNLSPERYNVPSNTTIEDAVGGSKSLPVLHPAPRITKIHELRSKVNQPKQIKSLLRLAARRTAREHQKVFQQPTTAKVQITSKVLSTTDYMTDSLKKSLMQCESLKGTASDVRTAWKYKANKEGLTSKKFCNLYCIEHTDFDKWLSGWQVSETSEDIWNTICRYVFQEPPLCERWKQRALQERYTPELFANYKDISLGKFLKWYHLGTVFPDIISVVWDFVMPDSEGDLIPFQNRTGTPPCRKVLLENLPRPRSVPPPEEPYQIERIILKKRCSTPVAFNSLKRIMNKNNFLRKTISTKEVWDSILESENEHDT